VKHAGISKVKKECGRQKNEVKEPINKVRKEEEWESKYKE